MNLFYQPLLPEGVLHLDTEESRHCVKVLRHKNGDELLITDGLGYFYKAHITNPSPSKCEFSIDEKTLVARQERYIHIAVSPTKNADRIEWFVEKAVEFGIQEITLLDCAHTERNYMKTDRLTKVAVSAMKQSLKATLPRINALTPFDQFVTRHPDVNKFIAYVDSDNPLHLKDANFSKNSTLVLIGPEGDFSRDELALALENSFLKVSLGTSRLRTETAALAACFILNLQKIV